MPPGRSKRRTHYRHRRQARRRRYGAPLRGTRWNRVRRVAQNLTRSVMWFKNIESISSDGTGDLIYACQTPRVHLAGDFTNYGIFFEEYKILEVIVKLYPAKVGSESAQRVANPGGIPGQPLYLRGDVVSWVDQRNDDAQPNTIFDVINKSSARLFQPRRFHKRWMHRPRSYPRWGTLNVNGTIAQEDPWVSSIRVFGVDFSPNTLPGDQTFFYAQTFYKVLFRNRRE